MEFSGKNTGVGWLFPSPGDLPNPEIEPRSPSCGQILYSLSHPGSPVFILSYHNFSFIQPVQKYPSHHYTTRTHKSQV